LTACSHLDQIQLLELPEAVEGCAECLASGGTWLHLRMCQSCGEIGCCDSSLKTARVPSLARVGARDRPLRPAG